MAEHVERMKRKITKINDKLHEKLEDVCEDIQEVVGHKSRGFMSHLSSIDKDEYDKHLEKCVTETEPKEKKTSKLKVIKQLLNKVHLCRMGVYDLKLSKSELSLLEKELFNRTDKVETEKQTYTVKENIEDEKDSGDNIKEQSNVVNELSSSENDLHFKDIEEKNSFDSSNISLRFV